jgi:hypothetical protein
MNTRNNPMNENAAQTDSADRIPVNGFQQVLEMLRIADPAFRESLLTRLARKDYELAQTLREDLANLGIL